LSCAADEIGTIPYPIRDHDAEGDGELLESDQCSSHLGWSQLSVIQGNQHAECSDTEARDKTTSKDVVFVDGACLHDHTHGEDRASKHDRKTPSNGIGKPTVE
jgi:hypothetical protein